MEGPPAHGGKEEWLEKKRDAVNRQAGKDDFWRNLLGSTSEVAVAATTIARGNEERNAKGTRRVARRGAKRRGTKRRGAKRRGTKRRDTKRRGTKRRGPKRR